MYTMTNLFPYVGYMVAGFQGDHADGAGAFCAPTWFFGSLSLNRVAVDISIRLRVSPCRTYKVRAIEC